ncbi:MAG: hypothetical protein JW925_11750 [Syntrophaceae bacterium]|nr:hypothetical protein [Syntrophaceae bacterium]
MGKTITLRIDDDTYDIFKTAAQAQRRTISNFIEYATLSHVTKEAFVDEQEMAEILKSKELVSSLRKAREDIKKGRYRIVK